jgi:hypothetical protein
VQQGPGFEGQPWRKDSHQCLLTIASTTVHATVLPLLQLLLLQ